MPDTKPLVQIKNINKFYGKNHVVKDLSIDVQEGEFLTILGSSGSASRRRCAWSPALSSPPRAKLCSMASMLPIRSRSSAT